MPITRPAVSYWHELGTRDGSSLVDRFGADESGSRMSFFVPWSERYNAVKSLLGYSQLAGTTAAPTALERLTPSRHPDVDTLHAVRVNSITGHGFTTKRTQVLDGGAADLNQFEKARIDVEYAHLSYGVLEDGEVTAEYERYTSIESIAPSAEYFMLPSGVLQYRTADDSEPDGQAIPFNTGVVLPVEEMRVKWWGLPFNLYSPLEMGPWGLRIYGDGTSEPYLGSVNQAEIFGCPPGTLLFSNIEIIPRRFPIVGLGWDVVFTLAFDPHGWNFKLYYSTNWLLGTTRKWAMAMAGGNDYEAPGTVTDHHALYNERPFADLFDVT